MTGREMKFLAQEVKVGLALGQSVHHAFASRDDLPRPGRSFYRHVENEAIGVRKMDLRKKARHKKRNKKEASRHEKESCAGREHGDHLLPGEEVRAKTVQTDCAEGT